MTVVKLKKVELYGIAFEFFILKLSVLLMFFFFNYLGDYALFLLVQNKFKYNT